MALEFTEYGKNLVLRNMFGIGGSYTYESGASITDATTSVPSLGGSNYTTSDLGQRFYIQFYGGTRPSISTIERPWQASAYAGSTKLWPSSTSNATALNTGTILAATASSSTYTTPSGKLTIDWTNNLVTTSASSLASNLLFAQGTVTWFAVYGGFGVGTGTTSLSNYFLVFTGNVDVTGSGADIEINRTDIPSAGYPVELKRLSFKFPQPTGVDLIFNKHIYTTALVNSLSAGTQYTTSAGTRYHYANFLNTTAQANAKYVCSPSGSNIVKLYTGTRPANPEAAVPGDATLVGSIDVGALTYPNMTFVNTSSETSLSKTGNFFGTAVASGSPTWCRIMSNTSGGHASIDCSAGLPGSGAAVIYQDAITAGAGINLTSLKFSMA